MSLAWASPVPFALFLLQVLGLDFPLATSPSLLTAAFCRVLSLCVDEDMRHEAQSMSKAG